MIAIDRTNSPLVVATAFSTAEQSFPSQLIEVELASLDHRGMETHRIVTHLPAILGRDLNSDVRLADPWVSRRHCVLDEIKGTLVVRDLGSKHGTFVNGHRGSDSHVLPGDRLTIGRSQVTVQYRRTERATTEARSCKAVANADFLPSNQVQPAIPDTEDL